MQNVDNTKKEIINWTWIISAGVGFMSITRMLHNPHIKRMGRITFLERTKKTAWKKIIARTKSICFYAIRYYSHVFLVCNHGAAYAKKATTTIKYRDMFLATVASFAKTKGNRNCFSMWTSGLTKNEIHFFPAFFHFERWWERKEEKIVEKKVDKKCFFFCFE